jgi:hydrogenase expression/formation protein HypE
MNTDTIVMAHGGGGRLSAKLIDEEIVTRFGCAALDGLPDAASIQIPGNDLVFSTDSFVISPYFFPGGDIGELAVFGTVNDLCVAGGTPRWLSLAMILEEGFPLADLRRILDSAARAAQLCGINIVTGDTKVVERGHGDGIFLNTAGIGIKIPVLNLNKHRIEPGDQLLVSGNIGEHGFAVLAARNGIDTAQGIRSDCAPLTGFMELVSSCGSAVKFMRDPTRGGVAAVTHEICRNMSFGIELDEAAVPLSGGAHVLSEMFGIDPLHAACEGRLLMICSGNAAADIAAAMRLLPAGKDAAVIGRVTADYPGKVRMNTIAGSSRLIAVPAGEILPRIC